MLCDGGMQSTECCLVTIIVKQHTVMMSQKNAAGALYTVLKGNVKMAETQN